MSDYDTLADQADAAEVSVDVLPLDGWHRAHGARMVPFAGYDMPLQYEGIMAEHLATRDGAGLFDVSHMGQLVISGEGSGKALELLLPGDVTGLAANRIRYSLLLAEDGGILDDLMITRLPADTLFGAEAEAYYLVVNGATKYDDLGTLREHLPDEITINHLADRALLALQGPRAGALLAAMIPAVDGLYFMQAGAFDWDGETLWISRSGYTGEDGFEISVDAERAEALADALLAAGAVPVGLGARDSLRLEAGLPLYGHDLGPYVDAIEADLGFAIGKRRRAEGGFFGHERVMTSIENGPATKRVGLSVEGKLPVREGAPLFVGDNEVGTVTSGGFAPTVGAPIAMGYVMAPHHAVGTKLEAEVRGRRIVCAVTATPFTPHRYRRAPKA